MKLDSSKIFFYFLVVVLMFLGVASLFYRVIHDQQPWLPGVNKEVWNIEGHIQFNPEGDEALTVSLKLPEDQPGFKILGQTTASPGYGLNYLEGSDGESLAEWTKRDAAGSQSLYYKVRILNSSDYKPENIRPVPPLQKVVWSGPAKAAATALQTMIFSKSSDSLSYTRELLKEFFHVENPDQNLELLKTGYSDDALIVRLLNQTGIPSHLVNGLYLEDGRRKQGLHKYLKLYDEEGRPWYFSMEDGSEGLPENFFIWNDYSSASLDVIGGDRSRISFSMIKNSESLQSLLYEEEKDPSLLSFSIYNLPIEEQSVYQVMLLIPLGVFVVVLLRVLVGVRTSGTFMPVLLAMAFMETSLVTGLLGFLLVVGTGLFIRSYLSRLNLLLVARISAVIITVIAIISVFTIFSYRLGLTEALKITYFPIIILSWTIERMSILWEEEGPKEVMIQGGSSLLVAVLVFMVINNSFIRYYAFNFLGLQLILLAFILLVGSYTGYRLTELKRFKPLVEESS